MLINTDRFNGIIAADKVLYIKKFDFQNPKGKAYQVSVFLVGGIEICLIVTLTEAEADEVFRTAKNEYWAAIGKF